MQAKEVIITISGLHGVGKSVYSKAISKKFCLVRYSSGELFRRKAEEMGLTLEELSALAADDERIDLEIDEYASEKGKEGGVVIDGLLSGWMLRDHAHIRFFLSAPLEERIRRIAERESKNFEEAKEETLRRERYERERFKRLYGMDLSDFSPYNVILDTTLMDIPSTQQVLFRIVEGYLVSH